MPQIDLFGLLAEPHEPRITVRLTPTQSVEVSQIRWKAQMAEILDFCVDLDVEDRLSWQLLREVTRGDGEMAKLLIALGEMLQVWARHPSIDFPELWGMPSLPMILAGSSVKTAAGRMPKPSRGDLEAGMIHCGCCRKMMGPADSVYHDLVAAIMNPKVCIYCEAADCEVGEPCRQGHRKVAAVEPLSEKKESIEEAQLVANEFSAYEDLFG